MILNERETRHAQIMTAVQQMMTAARTAPKGKGADILEIIAVEGKEIETLSSKTRELGEKKRHELLFTRCREYPFRRSRCTDRNPSVGTEFELRLLRIPDLRRQT